MPLLAGHILETTDRGRGHVCHSRLLDHCCSNMLPYRHRCVSFSGDLKLQVKALNQIKSMKVVSLSYTYSSFSVLRGPRCILLGLPKGVSLTAVSVVMTDVWDYKVKPPFFDTVVSGVYASGDCMTQFQVTANANKIGSTTGAGVAVRVQEKKYGIEPIY